MKNRPQERHQQWFCLRFIECFPALPGDPEGLDVAQRGLAVANPRRQLVNDVDAKIEQHRHDLDEIQLTTAVNIEQRRLHHTRCGIGKHHEIKSDAPFMC